MSKHQTIINIKYTALNTSNTLIHNNNNKPVVWSYGEQNIRNNENDTVTMYATISGSDKIDVRDFQQMKLLEVI